jgi:hypothetical protein
VADGNFKADHVWQKNSNTDVWLWDGGGMAPNQAEYEFSSKLPSERFTVGTLHLAMAIATAAAMPS